MRIALISDLHATMAALDAVLADIEAVGVDRIVCLGDIVDMGPEPTEVLSCLRERGIACVRGNHDPLTEPTAVPLLARVRDWTAERLDDADRAWLDGLPTELRIDLDGVDLLCVHATPRNDVDLILPSTPLADVDAMLAGATFDVLAMGHTHVQMFRRLGSRLLVNVGSVGMPFGSAIIGPSGPRVLPWAEYGVVEGRGGRVSVDLRRVPIDCAAVTRAVLTSAMPDPARWSR
jgi:putative phosphoesterase